MKKRVHIISHSHWDREWYMPFEFFRMRLVELIDNCLELFENDPSFKSFHLDGQTIVLDDYLEIRPENREKIKKYVEEGRFIVGPWYILQDEFLTSGESNVRNILVGTKSAMGYGSLCKMGYFPDAFGNAGQMPQLLKQAGIEAVVFGRGVKSVGFNNEIGSNAYESPYSEMIWKSTDGSEITSILFANWYSNGIEIPCNKEDAKKYWDERLNAVERFASTGEYLLMNGCDHQPVQKDVSKAIEIASELFPDIEFIHSNFPDYIKALKESLPDKLSVIEGELTSQNTDGWTTLVNTASSRIDLKMMNRRCESALENVAEPISVIASLLGQGYPADELTYAWKKLMQNHAHDSICGCSVDEVNSEVKTRFNKSMQTAKYLTDKSASYIANKIDTNLFEQYAEKYIPFAIFNTTGRTRSSVVSVKLDFERSPEPLRESAEALEGVAMPDFTLVDINGNQIPFTIEDLGVTFGYTLPDDRFRQPYMARSVRITFEAESVPAMGYTSYALTYMKLPQKGGSLVTADKKMENDILSVEIQEDGTFKLYDKLSDREYNNICWYEETGDIGDEYIYRMPAGTKAITTQGAAAQISLAEDTPYKAEYKVSHTICVPAGGDEQFEYEKAHRVDFRDRVGVRSENTVNLRIDTYISLEKHGKGVKVKTIIDNNAKDHRVRIMIPTEVEAETHKADSMFELVTRNNRHNDCWQNPSGCEHQQSFVSIDDGKAGISVANIGLYEYEMLPDMDNTIAVTLLRATGEMGDWGVFPTPESQMQMVNETEIEIIPHKGSVTDSLAYEECYQLKCEMLSVQLKKLEGKLPACMSVLDWSSDGLTLTGMKQKEDSEDIILRWVNLSDEATVLTVKKNEFIHNLYRSNVVEEKLDDITDNNGSYCINIKPYEIVTLGVSRQ